MNSQEMVINRIKSLCSQKEISYYTLSYRSAVPLSTIMHIMDKSTVNPGLITICKLCDGLGITAKEFFDSAEFEGLTYMDIEEME